jgi:hypothetical protein
MSWESRDTVSHLLGKGDEWAYKIIYTCAVEQQHRHEEYLMSRGIFSYVDKRIRR